MTKRLAIFLAVTFGLSWGLWIPAGIVLGTFTYGETSAPLMIILVALGMFFPLVGAVVAEMVCMGELPANQSRWRMLVSRLGFHPHIDGHIPYYLMAWFLPAGLALLGCLVYFLVFPQQFDPSLSYLDTLAMAQGATSAANLPVPPVIILAATIFFALSFAPFFNMIPSFGEEAGWRGLLFPELCTKFSQRGAALISGVIWGVWHAPIIAMGHNYGMGYVGFPVLGILTMTLACTAMGVWLAWLRVRTQSAWPASLAHGSFNAIAGIGVVLSSVGPTVFGPSPLGLIACLPICVLAVVCWLKL